MPECMYPIPRKLSEKSWARKVMRWRLSDRSKEFPSHWVMTRCGKCSNCVKQRRLEWCFRLRQHLISQEQPSYFLTLTYDDENLPVDGVCADDITKYFKRLRHCSPIPFSYFLMSEYGDEAKRPHYHAIIFNFAGSPEYFETAWKKGFIYVGDVTDASINYCAKYFITKKDAPEGKNSNFSRISKGIGKDFIKIKGMRDFYVNNQVLSTGSFKCSAPRYYKDKWEIDSFELPNHEFSRPSVVDSLFGLSETEYKARRSHDNRRADSFVKRHKIH